MKLSLVNLTKLLQENVVELKFKRRRPKPGVPPTRRMLCTNSRIILESREARDALNYRPTNQNSKWNATTKNLIITWDILMQDYRCISVDNCEIIAVIPGDDTFWRYYNDKLHKMTPSQKDAFMKV
jgi:hypothetical protein